MKSGDMQTFIVTISGNIVVSTYKRTAAASDARLGLMMLDLSVVLDLKAKTFGFGHSLALS